MPRFELGSLDSKSKVLTLTPHRLFSYKNLKENVNTRNYWKVN